MLLSKLRQLSKRRINEITRIVNLDCKPRCWILRVQLKRMIDRGLSRARAKARPLHFRSSLGFDGMNLNNSHALRTL